MARFDLSDVEWRLIKPRGVARVDDRRVLNGIFYVLRTGSPWRDLPERYGPYTTVYNRADRQLDHPRPIDVHLPHSVHRWQMH
jgi:transposase